MKELMNLFWAFCKIGGLTFGGGYAMLPMLQKEVVENYKWATEEELLDYYAVGQSTPGVIAVNTATFIGYKQRGIIGAFFATLGIVFPSLVIIMSLAGVLDQLVNISIVNNAFSGIRVVVGVLILDSVIGLYKKSISSKFDMLIMVMIVFLSLFFNLSPVYLVVFGGVLGLLWYLKNNKDKDVE